MSESQELVAELRAAVKSGNGNYGHRLLCGQAADKIERLQKQHEDDQRLLGWQEQHDPNRRVQIASNPR